jgi:hypothetical protein
MENCWLPVRKTFPNKNIVKDEPTRELNISQDYFYEDDTCVIEFLIIMSAISGK